MDNLLVILSIVEGIVLPILVSFLKGQQWSTNVKFLFSMVVSLAIAALTLLIKNDFALDTLLANAALIWSSAQAIYQTWFRSTSMESTLAAALPWSKPVG